MRATNPSSQESTFKSMGVMLFFILVSIGAFGQKWVATQEESASPKHLPSESGFGCSVSQSARYIAVGSRFDSLGINGSRPLSYAGAVYIYELDTSKDEWSQVQKLIAPDRTTNDQFGKDVAISGDTIIVSAPTKQFVLEKGKDTVRTSGVCYVYVRDSSGSWSFKQHIVPKDGTSGSFFGGAIAISGPNLIIGAENTDSIVSRTKKLSYCGAVYFFTKAEDGLWVERQKTFASDADRLDGFGESVSIHNNIAVVGAIGDDNEKSQVPPNNAGAVYVFTQDSGGNWGERAKIVEPVRDDNHNFGTSVGVSDSLIAIGVPLDDYSDPLLDDFKRYAGSVYIYSFNNNQVPSLVHKITPVDRTKYDYFGSSLALKGKTLVVGAQTGGDWETPEDTSVSGTAYFYNIDTSNSFVPTGKLQSPWKSNTWVPFIYSDVDIYGSWATLGVWEGYKQNGRTGIFNPGVVQFIQNCGNVTIKYDSTFSELFTDGNYSTYQWGFCGDEFEPILGATKSSYKPIKNGHYAVIVSNNNCIDTSNCVQVSSLSVSKVERLGSLTVYPNPSEGEFHFSLPKYESQLSLEIYNLQGKMIYSGLFLNCSSFSVFLDQPKGVYFAHVQSSKTHWTEKLILR